MGGNSLETGSLFLQWCSQSIAFVHAPANSPTAILEYAVLIKLGESQKTEN